MKKITSIVLAFVMMLSLSVPAFATEQTVMQRAQLEIDQQVEAAMAAVEDQMVGWDEGYINAYREIITATIEQSVLGASTRAARTYSLPRGGIVKYQYSDNFGDTYYVVATLLPVEATADFILQVDSNPSRYLDYAIGTVLGFIPYLMGIPILHTLMASFFTISTRADIRAAGNRMQIVSLLRYGDDFTRDTISGWHSYPYYTTHPDAEIVSLQELPK